MIKTLLILGAVLLGAVPAFSTTPAEEAVMKKHIQWIVDNTEYEYNNQRLPTVQHLSQEDMNKLYYSEESLKEMKEKGKEPNGIGAGYNVLLNNMVVPLGTDITDGAFGLILVHELVHYMQGINKPEGPDCAVKRTTDGAIFGPKIEEEAHRLSLVWALNNYRVADQMLVDTWESMWYYKIIGFASCPPEDHIKDWNR